MKAPAIFYNCPIITQFAKPETRATTATQRVSGSDKIGHTHFQRFDIQRVAFSFYGHKVSDLVDKVCPEYFCVNTSRSNSCKWSCPLLSIDKTRCIAVVARLTALAAPVFCGHYPKLTFHA